MKKNEDWSEGVLKTVRALYAMLIGSAIIYAAAFQALPHLLEDGLTTTEAFFGFAILFVGAVASMPWIFMSLAGELVKTVRSKVKGGG